MRRILGLGLVLWASPVLAGDGDGDGDRDETVPVASPSDRGGRRIGSGLFAIARIDGKGRGLAGGLGVALSPLDSVELELAGLKAESWGVYAGMRVRLLTGWMRPYIGAGVPVFFFTDDATMESAVAFGLRGAGGIEVRVNSHVSLQADVGIEHFFNIKDVLVDDKRPDDTLVVPTLGVIGRL